MSSDGGDLSCTDFRNAQHFRWAHFSMTSIQAASGLNDSDDGRTSVGLAFAGPGLGASVGPGEPVPLRMDCHAPAPSPPHLPQWAL